MSAFAYYSPLWLGMALAYAIFTAVYDSVPAGQRIWVAALVCPAAGLVCQLALIGFQGTFAQVLPAPRGKSIRGRGAAVVGGLLLLGIGFGVATALIGQEYVGWMAKTAAALAAGCVVTAIGAYFWCIPAAVDDFSERVERGA